jgi:hypothetical protein
MRVIAAIKRFPELKDSDLGYGLADVVFDMAETLASLPSAERKGMVESAIAA